MLWLTCHSRATVFVYAHHIQWKWTKEYFKIVALPKSGDVNWHRFERRKKILDEGNACKEKKKFSRYDIKEKYTIIYSYKSSVKGYSFHEINKEKKWANGIKLKYYQKEKKIVKYGQRHISSSVFVMLKFAFMALSELEIRKLEKIHIANGIGVHIFRCMIKCMCVRACIKPSK